MWPNPFIRLRRRAVKAIPAPEATVMAESTVVSHNPPVYGASSTISHYSRYTASPGASSYYGMSSSSASPVYTLSSRQASPFYAASSRHPSPLATGGTYGSLGTSAENQNLSLRRHNAYNDNISLFPAGYDKYDSLNHDGPILQYPPNHELGIASSRNNEIWRPREQHEPPLGRAVEVPQGLVLMCGTHQLNPDEAIAATKYTIMEDHLTNMRRALSGAQVDAVPPGAPTVIASTALSNAMSGTTLSGGPLSGDDKELMLAKIEEDKELEEEEEEIGIQDHALNARSQQEISELSTSCGSLASQETFSSSASSTKQRVTRKPVPSQLIEHFDILFGPIELCDGQDGWGNETVLLLQKIGMSDCEKA